MEEGGEAAYFEEKKLLKQGESLFSPNPTISFLPCHLSMHSWEYPLQQKSKPRRETGNSSTENSLKVLLQLNQRLSKEPPRFSLIRDGFAALKMHWQTPPASLPRGAAWGKAEAVSLTLFTFPDRGSLPLPIHLYQSRTIPVERILIKKTINKKPVKPTEASRQVLPSHKVDPFLEHPDTRTHQYLCDAVTSIFRWMLCDLNHIMLRQLYLGDPQRPRFNMENFFLVRLVKICLKH